MVHCSTTRWGGGGGGGGGGALNWGQDLGQANNVFEHAYIVNISMVYSIERLHVTSHPVQIYYFCMAKGQSTRASCNALSCGSEVSAAAQSIVKVMGPMQFKGRGQG